MKTYGVEFHQGVAVHFLSLVERNKLDILVGQCFVSERTLDSVQIVSTHGGEGTLSADVVVELILQVNEAVVAFLRESDVA